MTDAERIRALEDCLIEIGEWLPRIADWIDPDKIDIGDAIAFNETCTRVVRTLEMTGYIKDR